MTAAAVLCMAMLSLVAADPVPDGTRPGSTDEELTINAVPTRVREWMLDLAFADSRDFYRRYLGDRRIELVRDNGLILAAPAGGGFTTVELLQADAGRTRVRVSEARLDAAGRGPITVPVPVPADAQVLSSVSGGRGAEKSQALVARTGADMVSMVRFYERAFAGKGLRLTEQRQLPQSRHPTQLLSFAGTGLRVELVLTTDGGQTWISAFVSGAAP